MSKISYNEISKYISDNNIIGSGKEVNVYKFDDKVIKIFHNNRKTPIPRISDEGLIKLTTISLNCFNTPIDIIINNNEIIGYTEKYLQEEIPNFDNIDFELIKEDLYKLSNNGFSIEDLFYNYIFTEDKLYFTDLTCYNYINTNVEFLKNQILKKNITIMNNFLIGLLNFDAFKKGEHNEYTKIYLANEYRLENCSDIYYGDFIKEMKNRGK